MAILPSRLLYAAWRSAVSSWWQSSVIFGLHTQTSNRCRASQDVDLTDLPACSIRDTIKPRILLTACSTRGRKDAKPTRLADRGVFAHRGYQARSKRRTAEWGKKERRV
ncbi:hypothetical protein BU26DRAFT_256440 [Trematosphaeria pertusa]|uniref:Uncharacterized protein n=1 Tax=Trematosphaeria pertusa TaxID=390896 RepID=A0A6A6IQQ3_9PLEO|nr:uncharacterized protein BU26DRAFT_256440 [Trematosphaeria pertusa]KAF2252398.1 hypothetical protein BU26DRAFT_256440 [Trematosphaeria pertusa]